MQLKKKQVALSLHELCCRWCQTLSHRYSLRETSTATTHKMQTFEDQRQAALRGWNLLAACGCRGSKTHECGTLARTGISRLSTKQLYHSQADEGR